MKTLAVMIASGAAFLSVVFTGSAEACACAEPPVSDIIYSEQGPSEAGIYSATTQEEWEALWEIAGEAPKGRFEEGTHTAVAVFMGQKPSGGHDVVINGVYWEDTVVQFDFEEIGPEGPATQAITSPYRVFILAGAAELVLDRNDFMITPIGGRHDCGGVDEMEMVMAELEAAS